MLTLAHILEVQSMLAETGREWEAAIIVCLQSEAGEMHAGAQLTFHFVFILWDDAIHIQGRWVAPPPSVRPL